jgi:hypothetical protein
MSSRRRERQYLLVDAGLVQDPLPKLDIAVSGHDDVVVARIVKDGILLVVDRGSDAARALLDRY